MRIAIAATGSGLDSPMDFHFGRCAYFLIVEIEGDEIKLVKAIENSATHQRGGAGITAAQIVANEKADAVVAGAFGPRAFDVLTQVGTRMFVGVEGTVEENAGMFAQGKLKELGTKASVERHHGEAVDDAGRHPPNR